MSLKSFLLFYFVCFFLESEAQTKDTIQQIDIVDNANHINIYIHYNDTTDAYINDTSGFISIDSNQIIGQLFIREISNTYDLSRLDDLHFEAFTYEGNKRDTFPQFKHKKLELKKVNITGNELTILPSFISYKTLTTLVIESDKNKIDIENFISECTKLEILGCFLKKNKPSDLLQICKLTNLKQLFFSTSEKIHLDSTSCLWHLSNLTSLELNIDDNSIKELKRLQHLQEITFINKLSYEVALENIDLLKQYKKINLRTQTGGKSSELSRIREILPNVR